MPARHVFPRQDPWALEDAEQASSAEADLRVHQRLLEGDDREVLAPRDTGDATGRRRVEPPARRARSSCPRSWGCVRVRGCGRGCPLRARGRSPRRAARSRPCTRARGAPDRSAQLDRLRLSRRCAGSVMSRPEHVGPVLVHVEAETPRATMAPVTSEPPREKVLIVTVRQLPRRSRARRHRPARLAGPSRSAHRLLGVARRGSDPSASKRIIVGRVDRR